MSKLFRLLLPIIVILLLLPGCGKIKPKIVVDLKPLVKSAEYKEGTENAVIFKAMEGEINRSISSLKIDDSAPKLYFLSYLIQDSYSYTTQYGIGAKTDQYEMNLRLVFADVRVGDYKYDNFVHPSERDFYDPEITKFENITSGLIVPYDNNEKALRHALWLLTDVNYKKAVIEYTKKKSKEKTEAKVKEDKDLEDFTQEEVKSLILEETEPSVDKEYWDSYINAGAQELKNYPFLLSASLIFTYDHNKRYFMDSEGRKIQFSGDRISIIVTVETKAEDGMNLSNGFVLHGFVKEDFPSADDFVKLIKEKCDLLQKMQNAPIVDPYSGPVLIMAPAAGVFFHEVLGHRLESQRIRSVKEAETFKDMVGKKIINEYLNIFDDPTLKYFNDTPLMGCYPADEQGILSQRAELIENGILKGFLMSRYPVKGFNKSNGHGRGNINTLNNYGVLVARQGNLIITPSKAYSREEIMKLFVKEIKRQKKEYGIIVESTTGGFTVTERYDLQHFVQSPVEIYKYYPDGKKELIRGAEFGGTPLISLEKISAFGNDFEVFNGFCGAESGYVPVSAVAPTFLINELEIQKSSRSVRKPPVLPSPYKK